MSIKLNIPELFGFFLTITFQNKSSEGGPLPQHLAFVANKAAITAHIIQLVAINLAIQILAARAIRIAAPAVIGNLNVILDLLIRTGTHIADVIFVTAAITEIALKSDIGLFDFLRRSSNGCTVNRLHIRRGVPGGHGLGLLFCFLCQKNLRSVLQLRICKAQKCGKGIRI